MTDAIIQGVAFDERGLIPAVVQDAETQEVIALTYLDSATLARTLATGQPQLLSDSIPALNDAASRLLDVQMSTDGGWLTILILRDRGDAGAHKPVSLLEANREAHQTDASEVSLVDVASLEFGLTINQLYSLIADRRAQRPEGSYTTYLFNSGLDKILKKIAEESGEVIIAAKNKAPRELISELADLFYHLLVLMVERDVQLSDVRDELNHRAIKKPK
jgi:phosphoribosyl-AMP cyclohydrolase / phosphoribosyl-ATP pyrophosphohydrolase